MMVCGLGSRDLDILSTSFAWATRRAMPKMSIAVRMIFNFMQECLSCEDLPV
jgi:hypothetical protein